jgi:hypothetical protein
MERALERGGRGVDLLVAMACGDDECEPRLVPGSPAAQECHADTCAGQGPMGPRGCVAARRVEHQHRDDSSPAR